MKGGQKYFRMYYCVVVNNYIGSGKALSEPFDGTWWGKKVNDLLSRGIGLFFITNEPFFTPDTRENNYFCVSRLIT